jgi:hypothetical protein
MNLLVSIIQEISGLAEGVLPSQEGLLHGVRCGLELCGCR